jgi:hypothetical protein
VSTDYTGYPVLGATRPQSAPPSASPSHPPFPTSTPTDPMALPWNTTEQSHPYPYLQQQPMAPGMYHPPPVWGHGDFMPGHGMAVDPYRGVPLGFWPYPMQQPQAQRRVNIGDRLDPFMAGNHCMSSCLDVS